MTDVTTEEKNLADSVAIYGRAGECFRAPSLEAMHESLQMA
jgi:hypothetical protein